MLRIVKFFPAPLVALFVFLDAAPCGMQGCPQTLIGASQAIQGFLSKSGCTNPIADDTYLKTSTAYNLDALATVTGHCERTLFMCPTPSTCGCYPLAPQSRGVAGINIRELDAFGQVVFTPNPNNAPQTVDTRAPNTTTPDSATWSFNIEGERTLRYKNQVQVAAACEAGQSVFVETDRRFIATRCIPQFQRDQAGHLVHLSPTMETLVYVPPGAGMNSRMRTGITQAVTAWNDALAGTVGTPRFKITDIPCGGPFCVKTEQDNIPTGPECAQGVLGLDPATGQVISATITFPTASGAWSENFTKRLAGHELAHLMGLANNNTSCPTSGSLMKPTACNALGGYPTTPQPSDHLPVIKSTYGQTPTVTCPAS